MKLVTQQSKITNAELAEMSKKMFDSLVKAVVDIEQGIMLVDAELHYDQEQQLLDDHHSKQDNLWGINLYPALIGTERFIQFDSMINLRPSRGNKTRGVENPQ